VGSDYFKSPPLSVETSDHADGHLLPNPPSPRFQRHKNNPIITPLIPHLSLHKAYLTGRIGIVAAALRIYFHAETQRKPRALPAGGWLIFHAETQRISALKRKKICAETQRKNTR